MQRNASDFTVEYIDVAHVTESGKLTGRTDAIGAWEGRRSTPSSSARPTAACAWCSAASARPTSTTRTARATSGRPARPPTAASWTLSPTAAVTANTGYASSGSGATTLADGTLVAAYPAGQHDLLPGRGRRARRASTWPTAAPTTSRWRRTPASCTPRGTPTATASANMGEFVRTIYPTLGPIMKVPGSISTFSGNPGSLDQRPSASR